MGSTIMFTSSVDFVLGMRLAVITLGSFVFLHWTYLFVSIIEGPFSHRRVHISYNLWCYSWLATFQEA